MGWVLNLSLNRYCLIVSTGHLEKTFRKGPFNNYVDKMGGGGQKMSVFVHAQGIKTVHPRGGQKIAKFGPRSC